MNMNGFKGRRILICEDEALTAMALRKMLMQMGSEVEAVSTGEAAVAAASREHPDLVLMDIELPGISGIEAMQQIKGLSGTCVYMFSAYSDNSTIQSAFDAGADGYLVKPISGADVLQVLNEHCTFASESAT